ncbi:hypothetical protein AMS68_002686 [Peltaster fructicola]|uniref:Anaphase-promoting complex subunit 4 WD40 domain-containing protein n=1 Tax=Peltaster fructicola TaxID=286661 RepID=A0A6H0XRB4_9PEZI|nr:hypothetical protein AMS68_002686 [Peltaster fructicola]
MDVHRARFIPYPTPAISCLAFTRSNDTGLGANKPTLRLALARTNGSIEIWNPLDGVWVQETIFPAVAGNAVESLVWTQEPDELSSNGDVIAGQYRLFSIGSSSNVTEWDLETGTVKRKSTGNFSEIWCLTAQPRSAKPSTEDQQTRAQELVIGGGDGTLALLNTEDNDLQFKRFLARVSGKKARCLTVTYQKPEVVVAGFADSTIRVFDTRNGSILRTMSLGVGLPGAPKTTLVWKLAALPNGDLVSADSNGELRIWDGKTLSMSQRLHGHEGDCLDVIASSNGKTLFSGGVDGRIACFRRTNADSGRSSWSKVSHRKIHQEHGPVKTLAAYDGKSMSVFVAGGGDPAPVLVPLDSFGKEHMRSLPSLPQEAQVVSAPSARLVATWWDNTVYIYRFARQNSLEVLRDAEHAIRRLVGKVRLASNETIRSVALSPSGDLLAASTSSSTKLFQLRSASADDVLLKVRKLALPKDMASTGARLLALAEEEAEGIWLAAVSTDNEIRLTKVIWSASDSNNLEAATMSIELERNFRRSVDQTGFKRYNSTISKLTFTDDAAMLVTGDLSGRLDYWEVEGEFDVEQSCIAVSKTNQDDSDVDSDDDDDTDIVLYGQTWRYGSSSPLPALDSAPLVTTFRPSAEQNLLDSQLGDAAMPAHRRLLVITARHQLYEYEVRDGLLSAWSQRNPSSSLPDDFTRLRDRVIGAHWDPRERLWLYGSNFVFMLDVADDLQVSEKNGSNKRKRQVDNTAPSKRNKGSGAGGPITNGHDVRGSLTAMRSEDKKRTGLDLRTTNGVDMDIDDDEGVVAGDLTRLTHDSSDDRKKLVSNQTIQHWSTTKYRPILGMVALAHEAKSSTDDEDVLEVVIVERPPIPATRKKKRRQR